MNIMAITKINDCIDEPYAHEIHFNKEINLNFINYLSSYGNLEYFSDFPKAYFQIIIPDIVLIKGAEGNKHFQIILSKYNQQHAKNTFFNLLKNYKFKKAS